MSTPEARKLFWIGSPFFARSLAACGWQVEVCNFEELALFGWDQVVERAGWEPDVLVVADKSRPPFVLGMENFPCLTVFYCVDSHIHSYYPLYAQAFDVCLLSLKDHLPWFLGKNLPPERLWWFPPFAPDLPAAKPPVQAKPLQADPIVPAACASEAEPWLWDCLFVGTVDADTNPLRAHFMAELAREVPSLQVMRGDYRALFPQGRILINHCAAGDLNFRVFEALGCGGCLVTPAVGHGLHSLFAEDEQLLSYPPYPAHGAAAAAAAQVRRLLDNPHKAQSLREAGLAAINAGHRAGHRAAAFTEKLQALYRREGQACIARRQREAGLIRKNWLRMPYLLFAQTLTHPALRQGYVRAAQGLFTRG